MPAIPQHLVSLVCLGLACALPSGMTLAADNHHASPSPKTAHAAAPAPAATEAKPATKPAASGDPQLVVDRIRNALAQHSDRDKMHVLVGDDPLVPKAAAGHAPAKPHTSRKTHTVATPHQNARKELLTSTSSDLMVSSSCRQ